MSDLDVLARALRKNTEELQAMRAEVERLTSENQSLRNDLDQFTELNRLIVERVNTDLSSFERRMKNLDGILAGHECALIGLGADPEPVVEADHEPDGEQEMPAVVDAPTMPAEDVTPLQRLVATRASELEVAWAGQTPERHPPDAQAMLERIRESARAKRHRDQ